MGGVSTAVAQDAFGAAPTTRRTMVFSSGTSGRSASTGSVRTAAPSAPAVPRSGSTVRPTAGARTSSSGVRAQLHAASGPRAGADRVRQRRDEHRLPRRPAPLARRLRPGDRAGHRVQVRAGPVHLLCGNGSLGVDLSQLVIAPTVAWKFHERHWSASPRSSPTSASRPRACRCSRAFRPAPATSTNGQLDPLAVRVRYNHQPHGANPGRRLVLVQDRTRAASTSTRACSPSPAGSTSRPTGASASPSGRCSSPSRSITSGSTTATSIRCTTRAT